MLFVLFNVSFVQITDMVGEKGLVPTLFDTLEKNAEDGDMVRAAAESLNRIGKKTSLMCLMVLIFRQGVGGSSSSVLGEAKRKWRRYP